jgi:hypothetical protein
MFGQLLPNKNKTATVSGHCSCPEFRPKFGHLNTPSIYVCRAAPCFPSLTAYLCSLIACLACLCGRGLVRANRHDLSATLGLAVLPLCLRPPAVGTLKGYFKALEYEYRVKTVTLGTIKRYSIISLTLYLEWYSAYSIVGSGRPH